MYAYVEHKHSGCMPSGWACVFVWFLVMESAYRRVLVLALLLGAVRE